MRKKEKGGSLKRGKKRGEGFLMRACTLYKKDDGTFYKSCMKRSLGCLRRVFQLGFFLADGVDAYANAVIVAISSFSRIKGLIGSCF